MQPSHSINHFFFLDLVEDGGCVCDGLRDRLQCHLHRGLGFRKRKAIVLQQLHLQRLLRLQRQRGEGELSKIKESHE
jgi:hypothetical protein